MPTSLTIPANLLPDVAKGMLTNRSAHRPRLAVPLDRPAGGNPDDGLHVTWCGHSSALVKIEGHRMLLDPVWSRRCSPSPLAGPKRLHEMPVPLRDLPGLGAVVISHDHYDHLDMPPSSS